MAKRRKKLETKETPEVEAEQIGPKLHCYTVRAHCPNCGNRTFEKVLLPAEPQQHDILTDKCKKCESNLWVDSIYQRHEGD